MTLVQVLHNGIIIYGFLNEDVVAWDEDNLSTKCEVYISPNLLPIYVHEKDIYPFERTSKFLGHATWIRASDE